MSTVTIPTEVMRDMSTLVPGDDEEVIYPTQIRVGMVIIATDYIYRRSPYFFARHYCPGEGYGSTRPGEWCQVVEYKIREYPDRTGLMMSEIKFVGRHHDGALVNYKFMLLKDVTDFLVKRDSMP